MERAYLVVQGIRIAFVNLLIVAVIGCLLRFFFIYPLPGFYYGYVLTCTFTPGPAWLGVYGTFCFDTAHLFAG